MRLCALLSVLLLAAACNQDSSSGSGSGGPSGGGGSSDGGVVADGGSTTDGGTDSDGGTGSGGGSGSDGGTGTDGGTADDCSGLLGPAPGAATHSWQRTISPGACGPGYSDGDGTLALVYGGYYGGGTIDFVAGDGTPLTTATPAPSSQPREQADGFIVAGADQTGHALLVRYDSKGAETARTASNWWFASAEDPLGGVSVAEAVLDHPDGAPQKISVRNSDAHLVQRWETILPPNGVLAVGVDLKGNTLVVTNTKPVNGIWLDHSGNAGSSFKLFDNNDATVEIGLRVGGGLFIAHGGTWLLQLDPLSTTPTPAPDWLNTRPNTSLHMVHAGTGYAVLHEANATDCSSTIDVVSPSGKVCGSQVFKAPAGGACATGRIRVGYDGSVLQQLYNASECQNGTCVCRWQWWTSFF